MAKVNQCTMCVAAAIILVGLLTAIGSYQKCFGLERSDSALYAYGGFLVEHGGRLYRDLWDHKPPGVYVIDSLAFRFLGDATWAAVVAADTLATVLAVLACIWTVGCLAGGTRAAAAIASITAAFYLNLAAFHEGGGMAEIYMTAFLAWGGWAFVASRTRLSDESARGGRESTWLLALAGGLAGLAALCKPTAMTTAMACLVTLAAELLYQQRRCDLVRQVSLYMAGLTAPLLMAGFVFLRQGNLDEFVDASLLYNFSYVQQGAALSKLWTFHLQHNAFLLAGCAIVLGAGLVWLRTARPKRLPARLDGRLIFPPVWLLFEWLGIYAGNYNDGQYMLGCAIPLSCLAGIGARYLLRASRSPAPWQVRRTAAICLLSALALAWLPMQDQWRRTMQIVRSEASELAINQLRTGEMLRRACRPEDRIWVWGYAPQVYLTARRWPATRFVFDGVFLNSGRVLRREFREMVKALDCNRPVYIVDAATTGWFAVSLSGPMPSHMPANAGAYREELIALRAWVTEHYVPVEEYGELTVYRRMPEPVDGSIVRSGNRYSVSASASETQGPGLTKPAS